MAGDSKKVQFEKLTEGTFLFCSPQGNVLFGCPPEVLKRILAANLPMPDTVVVPEKLHHFHSSQASLEFPLYHFLFVQRGLERKRMFQVVAYPQQCDALAEMLRVTVFGPTQAEMAQAGLDGALAQEIHQECEYMALKKASTKQPYTVREMIHFVPMGIGGNTVLYPARQMLAELRVERAGPASFRVLYGEDSYDVDMTVTEEQEPNYQLRDTPFEAKKGQAQLYVLGRSNGFDPRDPANGYVFNFDGRIVVWDSPAYLHQHLKRMRVDPKQIEAMILSHVHEDHIDVAESLRDPPHELWATPDVYFSLCIKLAAVFGCSMEEAKKFHHWHPIDDKTAVEIGGAKFEFFHSVHAIPAIGARISTTVNGRKGLLHLSGDHLSNEALAKMHEQGGVSKRRFDFFGKIITGDETVVLVDAGGGAIHGDYRDYLNLPGRVIYMHTGLIQEALPDGKKLVASGEVLDLLEGR